MKYLHNLKDPIIHRDIKPENILLDKNDDVKLAGNTGLIQILGGLIIRIKREQHIAEHMSILLLR